MIKINKNLRFYVKQREGRIKRLMPVKAFMAGSMVKIAHTCGKPTCKCATEDELHEQYYLIYKVKGKTTTRYIPMDLEDEIRNWTIEYKRIRMLMKEINSLQLKILEQYKVEKKARKKIGQPTDELLSIIKQKEVK